MKNMLRAVVVAVLFASGAQAATVDGPLDVVPVLDKNGQKIPDGWGGYVVKTVIASSPVSGNPYFFNITLETADLLPLPEGWGSVVASRLWMTIRGQGVETTTASELIGPGSTYSFQWMWQTDGPANFDFVDGYLERYQNGKPSGTIISTDTQGPFISDSVFAHSIQDFSIAMRQAETTAAPVPIGGTLPLMLSALGLGAFVMRRRAKKAVLA